MKWLSLLKNLKAKKLTRLDRVECFALLNDQKLENVKIIYFAMHHDTYKRLRSFKMPQYEIFYLMRGKKGFNTILFQQNYDVIITNKDGKVIETISNVEPGFVSDYYDEGYCIYFTTLGTINFYDIKNNDILKRNRVSFFEKNKLPLF